MNFNEWEEEVRLQLVGSGVDAKTAAARAREFRKHFVSAYKGLKKRNPIERNSLLIRFALLEVNRQSFPMKSIVEMITRRLNRNDAKLRHLVENSQGFRLGSFVPEGVRKKFGRIRSLFRRRKR
jgi:hypothetical protein